MKKNNFKRRTDPIDYVEKSCKTCEFNFGEICAAHYSLYGYGNEITDYNVTCDQWKISYDAFSEEMERRHS